MDIEIVVAYIHVSVFDQKGTREATRAFKRLRKGRQRVFHSLKVVVLLVWQCSER